MPKTSAHLQKAQATEPTRLSHPGRMQQPVQNPPGTAQAVARRPDRRVPRTHRALREALLHLIRERGWDGVRVQDVCERADVGRSTFYLHFADKEELLVSGFGDLRKALRAHLAGASGEPLDFALALMEHARDFKEVYKAMLGRRTGLLIQRSFMDVLKELVAEDLARAAAPGNVVPEVAVSYVAGAFWEVLSWWFEQRKPPPAEELAAVFKRLTLPLLPVIQERPLASGREPKRGAPR
jgi:AcrR family transcriptional regulator